MAQVKNREPIANRELDPGRLLGLARKRTNLPNVPIRVKYEDDVDLLCLRFGKEVDPSAVDLDDEQGVVGIYRGRKLIGVEILDITNRLRHLNPR